MSGKFINFNRNKRSIVLDIKQPEGLAALKRLIAARRRLREQRAARRRWPAPASTTRAWRRSNPRLIHCSILAFGRGGRYFNRPAYDPDHPEPVGRRRHARPRHRRAALRADGDERPHQRPDRRPGIGFALYRREKTGKGEAIDVPMLENMASFVSSEHLGATTFDPPVGPTGDGRLLSPDYRPLPTKDGYITVRPNTNRQAFAFFDAIGRPELKTDPRFDSAGGAHRERRRLLRGAQARAWRRRRRPNGWRSSTSSTCRRRATTRSTTC